MMEAVPRRDSESVIPLFEHELKFTNRAVNGRR